MCYYVCHNETYGGRDGHTRSEKEGTDESGDDAPLHHGAAVGLFSLGEVRRSHRQILQQYKYKLTCNSGSI